MQMGMTLAISSSMPDLMHGTRMTVRSAIRDADVTTRRTLIHVSGGAWTEGALSLKYLMTRTALNDRSMMAYLSQISHGLTPVAALQRTLTLLWGGLPHTCPAAPSLNICVLTGKLQERPQYMTIVVNHDTNTVVWATQGHGKSVLT